MDIYKILAICLIATILTVILRQYKSEYAMVISVAAAIIVISFVIESISTPLSELNNMLQNSGIELSYFKIALKALGIGYVTGFIADTCRDFGQTSLAFKAELAGKCAIFVLSVPLLISILEIALGFVK